MALAVSVRARVDVVGAARRPEAVTAGAARISRDATPVPELVRQARHDTEVSRARNERVVYEYGHSSIAEHFAPTLAIHEIPRSLSVVLLAHRLASYTQQSGRYIPFERLARPYFLPAPWRSGAVRRRVVAALARNREDYLELYRGAAAHLRSARPELSEAAAARLATEDARYALSCLQTTQVAMTANARTWALVIRRLRAGDLAEERELAERLFGRLHPLAPSLLPDRHLGPDERPAVARAAVAALVSDLAGAGARRDELSVAALAAAAASQVRLVAADPAAEALVAQTLAFDAAGVAPGTGLAPADVTALIGAAAAGMAPHDRLPRAFELASYTFELELAEATYHQWLRHRMATTIPRPLTAELGAVVPPLLAAAGLARRYRDAVRRLEDLVEDLGDNARARTALANGHRRRLLWHVNARELVEFTRLRSDRTAQWDIRAASDAVAAAVAAVHPSIGALCGARRPAPASVPR